MCTIWSFRSPVMPRSSWYARNTLNTTSSLFFYQTPVTFVYLVNFHLDVIAVNRIDRHFTRLEVDHLPIGVN